MKFVINVEDYSGDGDNDGCYDKLFTRIVTS